MMNFLKNLVRKLIYKENASSEDLLNYFRKNGAEIGTNVVVYAPNKTLIDKTNPWLLKIGNHVRITEGVKILMHDYSWSVLKCYSSEKIRSGSVLGAQSSVEIGDNVFIGMNAIITRGVKIGDNVIIGAGSVITKDCEPNGVYAGNPARRIMSIEEFYNKRKSLQFTEAKNIAIRYKERFGVEPPLEVFCEYFMLFSNGNEAEQNKLFKRQMQTSMNYDDCVKYMDNHKPMFSDYETFLEACYNN